MTPLRPAEELPALEGLGVDVRLALPGYAVADPTGVERWLLGEDLTVELLPNGDLALLDPDLAEAVVIPRADVVHAAAQLANLIVARRHDARAAARVLDAAILPDPDAHIIRGEE